MNARDPDVDTCVARYDEMADGVDFFLKQQEQYIAESLLDCTEAVDQTDENVIAKTLADIGNRALWIRRNGDTDEKLAYVDEVCAVMSNLINKYAEGQALIDLDRRLGEGSK